LRLNRGDVRAVYELYQNVLCLIGAQPRVFACALEGGEDVWRLREGTDAARQADYTGAPFLHFDGLAERGDTQLFGIELVDEDRPRPPQIAGFSGNQVPGPGKLAVRFETHDQHGLHAAVRPLPAHELGHEQ